MGGPQGRTLKILHVIDSLGEGGSENNLLTLVRNLPANRCEHHLAWLYDDRRLLEAFQPHVAHLHGLHARPWLGLLGAAVRLARIIRADRPDVIHAAAVRAQLVARLASWLASRVPVVTTWQCVSYNSQMYAELGWKGPPLRALTRFLDATTGTTDRHFIAVSREVADFNARKLWVSPGRVTVVYNAVEPARVAEVEPKQLRQLRQELKLDGRHPVVLSVGRLVDQKNHETTIDAMSRILAEYPTALLLVAGKGPLEEQLRERARLAGLDCSVRLLGARTDVPALLRVADVFVFASRYEGFGIALAEALAAGVPVAASRIGTSLEVTEGVQSVRFFEVENSDELARSVLDLLRDETIHDKAALSRQRILKRFSPHEMANQFFDVITRAAGMRE